MVVEFATFRWTKKDKNAATGSLSRFGEGNET